MENGFRTHYRYYEYKVMPFDLVNAPATFQAITTTILPESLDHGVVVYLDDILIYSNTIEDHEARVKQVLTRVERHDLAVSLKISVFNVDTVEFLAYIVGKSRVTMSEKSGEYSQSASLTFGTRPTNLPWFCKFLSTIHRKLLKSLQTNYRQVENQGRKTFMVLERQTE